MHAQEDWLLGQRMGVKLKTTTQTMLVCVQVQEDRLLGWGVAVRILFLAVGMVKEFNSRAGIAACLKVGNILKCAPSCYSSSVVF